MLKSASHWLNSAFSTLDDKTPCVVRIFGVLFATAASVVFIGLAIHTVMSLNQPFDYMKYAEGLSLVWGTVSLAIIGKRVAEAKSQPTAE